MLGRIQVSKELNKKKHDEPTKLKKINHCAFFININYQLILITEMDDFNLSTLHESKSEWASRLLIIFTPLIIEGLRSIFNEANKMCKINDEPEKYLMTFQNLLLHIPKWGNATVETERKRIVERSGCPYLEDLVTCVHIVQLKILTAMRVGSKQKKINIDIPKLDVFIHKAYINTARKVYNNVYLYETSVVPLQIQKNHRELEIIAQECILNTIRESIPVETILRAYMDETIEEEETEEIKEQIVPQSQSEFDPSPTPTQINGPPSSTNPELNELREMQKMLKEEVISNPIVVDVSPISRPPSVENLLMLTEDAQNSDKITINSENTDNDVILDFENL